MGTEGRRGEDDANYAASHTFRGRRFDGEPVCDERNNGVALRLLISAICVCVCVCIVAR